MFFFQGIKKKLGVNFYPLKTDLTNEAAILNSFKWVKEHLGGIHILVNNAGILNYASLQGK